MSNKRRGIEKERQAKHELEKEGYLVVRARGSFGKFDLIALNTEHIKLVQVKRVKGKYASFVHEIKEIKDFVNHPNNTVKELWIWFDHKGWTKRIIE